MTEQASACGIEVEKRVYPSWQSAVKPKVERPFDYIDNLAREERGGGTPEVLLRHQR